MPAKDGLAIKNTSQKNKGFVVTTCMTSVNPAKNTPQRMAQTKQVRPNRRRASERQESMPALNPLRMELVSSMPTSA
jgi:hypothetical protein